MPVTFRPTIPSDLSLVIGEPLPYRIKAITVLDGDQILGVGGLAFPPDSPIWAFVHEAPPFSHGRKYPIAFHRAGLKAMQMIRESGVAEVVATCDPGNPAASRWLRRLGFFEAYEQKLPGKTVFFWQRST